MTILLAVVVLLLAANTLSLRRLNAELRAVAEAISAVAGHVNTMDVADAELKRDVQMALGQITLTLNRHVNQTGGAEVARPIIVGRKAAETRAAFRDLEEKSRLEYEGNR